MNIKRMLMATAVAVSVATPALAELVIPSLVDQMAFHMLTVMPTISRFSTSVMAVSAVKW